MARVAFSIDYRLVGSGWAECDVTCCGQRVSLTASYLSDALGQLAAGALLLRMGAPSARVSFDEEPGEYRWGFDHHRSPNGDVTQIRVRIWWFRELWGRRPDDEGELQFDALAEYGTFYNAVLDALTAVLERHGEQQYQERWVEFPFPRGTYDDLQRLVEQWPGRTHRPNP